MFLTLTLTLATLLLPLSPVDAAVQGASHSDGRLRARAGVGSLNKGQGWRDVGFLYRYGQLFVFSSYATLCYSLRLFCDWIILFLIV